jgi:periplasmic divalent cation tolerance protein
MRIILTTCSSKDASVIVRSMLEKRLVGCGNIVPGLRSMYWWQGEIQDDSESLLIMETPADLIQDALSHLNEIHPYTVPKILALEPTDVHRPYMDWLREETTQ